MYAEGAGHNIFSWAEGDQPLRTMSGRQGVWYCQESAPGLDRSSEDEVEIRQEAYTVLG